MLKNDIGINAGIIWQLLSDKGKMTIRQIGELTGFKEEFIYLSLGWLARENNIRFFTEEELVYVELLNVFPERFY